MVTVENWADPPRSALTFSAGFSASRPARLRTAEVHCAADGTLEIVLRERGLDGSLVTDLGNLPTLSKLDVPAAEVDSTNLSTGTQDPLHDFETISGSS